MFVSSTRQTKTAHPPTWISLQEMCDEGVRRAWLDPDNKLRGSILRDPAFSRKNTIDNTPCRRRSRARPGATIDVTVAAKGGGSEAKSKFVMLNPSDSILDWVLKTVPTMGAGWCPPGMLGIGIGGTAEKAMLLAKQSLMDPIDMQELKAPRPPNQHRTTPQSTSTTASTHSASARRASAASPPCSTSKSSTGPPTPPTSPSP